MPDPLTPEPTLETIRTVHASFRFAADDLERLGAPGDRVERRTVVAWLRSPAVAAGFLLDELVGQTARTTVQEVGSAPTNGALNVPIPHDDAEREL